MKGKRNFKNFNHWIAEIKTVARKNKVTNEGSKRPLTIKELGYIFYKANFEDYFRGGLTPEEAFKEEVSNWD